MADLVLLQLPRTAQASIAAAFATVGVTVQIPHTGKRADRVADGRAPVAVVLRDPIDRLESHFNSRLRSGRPYRPEIWTDWEAGLFTVLPTFNTWGEAILSKNEFIRSASDRAYAYWYRHHLSLQTLFEENRVRDVTVAGTVEDLPAAVARLAEIAGCEVPELSTDPAVIDPTPESLRAPRSELANLGFRAQLAEEIKLYERLLGRMR